MKYTEEEMLQDIANGVLQDMETMLEMTDGKVTERADLPPMAVKTGVEK